MPRTDSRTEGTERAERTGRTVVVAGTGPRIGESVARRFADEGCSVALFARSEEYLEELASDVSAESPGDALAVPTDVTDPAGVAAGFERVREAFGPVDVLVNNAGITIDKKFENMTREDWDRVMQVNLGGVFNCTKVYFDDIRDAEGGRLINISSVVGQQGNYGQANYATTKSGLFGFTRTIALELAHEHSTANCVAPGFVETDMLETVPERVQEKILDRIPLSRFATTDDVAGIVRFLASEDSSYMTGQILAVNGGMEW